MFKNLRASKETELNHSGRSYIGETLQLEGEIRSSGSVDVAGLKMEMFSYQKLL